MNWHQKSKDNLLFNIYNLTLDYTHISQNVFQCQFIISTKLLVTPRPPYILYPQFGKTPNYFRYVRLPLNLLNIFYDIICIGY